MSRFLERFSQSVDYALALRAPYDSKGESIPTSEFDSKVKELEKLIKDPAFKVEDLPAYLDAIKHQASVGLDDRELLLEKLLVLMSRLESTIISRKIQQFVISLLYEDLPHPPVGYLSGPDTRATTTPTVPTTKNNAPVPYAFRAADGSNCSNFIPSLGKAGSPYARSVPPNRTTPKHVLPDAEIVFDTLLRRKEFVPHPGGISSLFFAFADLIIHCIFNTDHRNPSINKTSSYLDLSVLYGNSEEEVNKVRKKDGTGKIWDDVFADGRLLFMPPATCALLVLLSRNHNYIAEKLLNINENGTFSNPPSEADRLVQDDELFHRTRLVNCGFFMNIILGDYVGAILGLVRDGSNWRLDPLMHMRELNHQISPRGAGNVVSIEFNLLYRWHTALSEKDVKWTRDMLKRVIPDKEPEELTKEDYLKAARTKLTPDPDLKKWTFGGLERQANGRFNDEDLAEIIQNATEAPAASFTSGVPDVLRVIEVMGIEQSRAWGTCSLNEFRKFIGLKPYKNFEEWNPDKNISTAAAALYKDINNLELHVGLQAEQCKEPGPGAGLCPGYTISRAILSDAVCLTRGDRFLTTDFTPYNCTQWGYDDCQYDKKDGSYGGLLTKLLFRTLPDQYPAGSAYAHFPFLHPSYMKENLAKESNIVDQYNWDRPHHQVPPIAITTYEGVRRVLDESLFMSAYDDRLFNVVSQTLKYPPSDRPVYRHKLREGRTQVERYISSTLKNGLHDHESWAEYFKEEAQELIREKSIGTTKKTSRRLDIVHEVIDLLPVRWISERILGLPLKTITNKHGAWYSQPTYKKFADIGRYIFFNIDQVHDWHLRTDSVAAFEALFGFTEAHLNHIRNYFSGEDVARHLGIEGYHSHEFLGRLSEAFPDVATDELSAFVIAAVAPTATIFSKAITHVIDFYLAENKEQERAEIVKLSESIQHEPESTTTIMTYVREALRHNPPVPGVYRTAAQDVSIPGYQLIRAQECVFASLVEANRDGDESNTSTRPPLLGVGEHGLLSAKFFESVVPTIVGLVLGLKNVRRAPGVAGKLTKFEEKWHGSPNYLYIDVEADISPFPDSLFIEYDD